MDRKKEQFPRVLLVGPQLPTGGITRFLDFCFQSGLKADLQLFNVARPPKKKTAFRADGYKELFNSGFKRALIGILITIKNILIFPLVLVRSPTDIVHLAGTGWLPFWEFSAYGLIAKMMRKKVIFHFHGPFEDFYRRSRNFIRLIIGLVLNKMDAVIVLSHQDKIVAKRLLPKQKIYLIPNGVKIRPERQSSDKYRKPLRVLFLGGVDPIRKGLLDLLEAASLIQRAGIQIEWFIGGTETALSLIQTHISLEASNCIQYIGLISESEKVSLYNMCDFYALPSYEEGMPYAILEAMSYGLAILSTRVGGIPEVVKEGFNGFLVNPGDYESLARCIINLKNDPDLIEEITKNNQKTIFDHYSEEKIVNQIEHVYDLLLSKHNRSILYI